MTALYMAYNHNDTELMKAPASKSVANREATAYRRATGNASYIEIVSGTEVVKEMTPYIVKLTADDLKTGAKQAPFKVDVLGTSEANAKANVKKLTKKMLANIVFKSVVAA